MQRRSFVRSVVAGAAGLPFASFSQTSAQRTTLHVPFPPGGASDALARHLAPPLEEALERSVVVENTPGASGTLSAQRMFAAPADGSALMVVSSSETIMPPLLMPGARFQAEDFRLLVAPMFAPVGLVARTGLGLDSLQALLAGRPDATRPALSYGSFGHGSIAHLAGEHFARLTKLEMTHVPYRGGAPLLTDLLGQQVDLAFFPLAGPVLQMAAEGKLKVLGVASTQRLPHLASHALLTAHPALAGFVHTAWNSIAVARAVPEATAVRLNMVLNEILQRPEVRTQVERLGSHVPAPMGLAGIASVYAQETAATRALARAIDLKMI